MPPGYVAGTAQTAHQPSAGPLRELDGKPHFIGLFAHLERQKCTACPLFAYHLLDALRGFTRIPKLQREIGALVASQSIVC
jgi:hypothetical protein